MPYQKRSDRRGGENFAAGAVSEGTVAGRNAFRELLASGRSIDKVFVQRGERSGSITLLIAQALERKIPVIEADKRKLDALSGGASHQGVVALAGAERILYAGRYSFCRSRPRGAATCCDS